ncbi:MAG: tripartite tricarboxylate transporter substrate binding protein [Deltaproteobacteria bacterium]|nr:MAG: tripartite tricarboxylate transporter substrate binding protein [Deltaproteobacteria bacterium]
MMTRKEFLEEVMKMANLKDLKQAGDATQAVISLTKLIIGTKLSKKIANISPPDLRQGWESIRAAFPKKAIKIITGPGGEDADVREIASYVQKYLGVDVLVENIVGFWGKIAFEKFQRAEPDGYTLLSYTFPRSIIIENMSKTNFRTKDFTPIFAWSVGDQVLVVPPDTYKTFDEFLTDARTRTLTGAIPVRGGTSHLAGLLLADGLGINVNWASYSGSAPSIAALSRKDVDFTICLAIVLPSWIRAGKISPLAVLPDRRGSCGPYFPEIPTLKELGHEINYVTIRHVVEAPPDTPPHIVSVLEEAFSKAVKEPAYIEWAKKNYVVIDPLSAQEFCEEVAASYPRIEKFKEMLEE